METARKKDHYELRLALGELIVTICHEEPVFRTMALCDQEVDEIGRSKTEKLMIDTVAKVTWNWPFPEQVTDQQLHDAFSEMLLLTRIEIMRSLAPHMPAVHVRQAATYQLVVQMLEQGFQDRIGELLKKVSDS